MLLDIVILPSEKVRKSVSTLTKKISEKFPLRFRVDNKKLIPHITLFHVLIKDADLANVQREMELVIKGKKKMNLSFSGIKSGSYAIGASIKPSSSLSGLHKRVVKKINKYRSGKTISKFKLPILNLDRLKRRYIKEYGVSGIFDFFWPHVTLCLLKNIGDSRAAQKLAEKYKLPRFQADTVAITKVNNYFQVTKILKTFKLK